MPIDDPTDQPDRALMSMMRTVLSTLPAVVLRVSLDGVIEYVNRVLPEYAGASLVGQPVYAFAPPDQHAAMRVGLEQAIRTRQPSTFETVALAPDGTRDWYHTTVGPIIDGGELRGLTLVCVNVSALKRATHEASAARSWLDVALKAGNVGAWSTDLDSNTVTWSDTLAAMFGLEASQAPRTLDEFRAFIPADQLAVLDRVLADMMAGKNPAALELRVDTPRGPRIVSIQGSALRDEQGRVRKLFGGVVDITERRALEAQVRFAQKMEAVGQLSAGVAHNFNNVLAVIVPALELASSKVPAPDRQFIADALQSATRAATLVRQLMAFSRIGTRAESERERLEPVVRRAVDLCQKAIDTRVVVTLDVQGGGDAAVDAAQVENAVVNLLLNARDALLEAETPAACVHVTVRRVPGSELSDRFAAAGGEYVEIAVKDNGPGIEPAVQRRIFEPFFTTKAPGTGTGLGLATVWATAEAHAGFADCASSPGAGATFHLWLRYAPLPKAPSASTASIPAASGTGRHVLVVDDEPAVARATSALLRGAGYEVTVAGSGVKAARARAVDAAVLDYSMPGQSAAETLAQLRALRPGLRVLCFSGLGASLDGADAHLAKPATPRALLDAIERLLG